MAGPKIGFVGLGNQGAPIAARIAAAGHPLHLWARRPETLADFPGQASIAESLPALAAAVDILCICVVDDAGVIAVCDTALPAMRAGATIAILSTVSPETCRAIAARAAGGGVTVIDAPVSGGAAVARAGTMAVMLGGPQAACDAVRPVFESFATLIERLGAVGAGQAAKIVNNALLTAQLMLAHEAQAAGAALGLDTAALARVIAASSGRSYAYELRASLPSLAAFENGARLLAKDLALFERLVAGAGASAPAIAGDGRAFLRLASSPAPGEPA
ncbi:NAD(P)-dependent oxidoreductase [Sphingomonas immobilis]|uniref:NAD(P)-binding domain-containing protein n=1 Tax=Sphingomonas immobilis TaxID=3063997 RepID=A0ABT8ZXA6_9SPHN|nr:NAD(P)-binding domain-containing protein [Sphingomonas sp. CA1-15]MDO7842204.1 NAD(P)-binding domain-containing protein [Sphingomonas sp. CA1-15]